MTTNERAKPACRPTGQGDIVSLQTARDIVVTASSEEFESQAAALALRLGIYFVRAQGNPPAERLTSGAIPASSAPHTSSEPLAPLALRVDEHGLALLGDGMELRADFRDMIPRLRPDRLHRELLVRAAKVKDSHDRSALPPDAAPRPTLIDATAGLGTDSLLLAAAGFEVTMFERNPVIAALLSDAMRRAALVPELAEIVAHMHLIEDDSIDALRRQREECLRVPPDVVYLDPMFPERRKSAAVKKKFQLLHYLERPCDEESQREMLRAAMAARPRKVVVKRPVKGPNLAGVKPSYSISGKAARYDCIVVPPREKK
jgi:16S rRNA (guanine1516-N2)-methyltransferase